MSGWVIWFTGLPGCGKSTLARGVRDFLEEKGIEVMLLEMDERRRTYVPNPQYSEEEREKVYAMFADEAVALSLSGHNVIMDGVAHRLKFRHRVRKKNVRFAEVCIRCDVQQAMHREGRRPQGKAMAGLYAKALERRKTGRYFEGLGDVVGVDVSFEEDPTVECLIDNTNLTPKESLDKVLHFLDRWLLRD